MSSEEKKASLSLVQSLLTLLPKGPFIFYEAGETGGIWGGGSPKKNGGKEGGGRVTRNILVHVELT